MAEDSPHPAADFIRERMRAAGMSRPVDLEVAVRARLEEVGSDCKVYAQKMSNYLSTAGPARAPTEGDVADAIVYVLGLSADDELVLRRLWDGSAADQAA